MLANQPVYDINQAIAYFQKEWLLAFKFFVAFSRFEFALKQCNFATTKRKKRDDVWANWEAFVDSIAARFDATALPQLEEAVTYLCGAPPKHQILRGRSLVWDDTLKAATESDLHYLLRLVKAIRNNLFHGGKYPFDRKRDRKLLHCGLTILEAWLELEPNVKHMFYEVP